MKKNQNESSGGNSQKLKKLFPKAGMLVLITLLTLGQVFAQQVKTVKGTVTDNNGSSLPGVSVSVKGTTTGTITNNDGTYTIGVPATGKLLVFSFVGMKVTEVAVGSLTTINVTMAEEAIGLEDVIVVGYGTQKRVTLSGAVAQVNGDDVLKGKATTNIASALQGEIPGLTITRTSSRPGNEGTTITLRGGISVNAISPMIVIDGIEAYSWELSQINPKDVESISVLKDAAASIYGTRAAGGVILVTTKRGKDGKVKVTYSGSTHLNYIGNRFPVASGQEWAQMNIEANTNDEVASGSANNWWLFSGDDYAQLAQNKAFWRADGKLRLDPTANQFDAVYGNSWGQNHNFSVSGGNDKVKVITSLGFAKDRSLVKVALDGTEKYTFRTNVDYVMSKWAKAEVNVSYDKRIVSTPTDGIGNGIQDMFVFPLYNDKGQFYDAFGTNNLLSKLIEGGRTNNTESIFRLGSKLTLDMGFIKPLQGLTFSANANMKERKGWKVVRRTTETMYDWNGELGKPNNIFFQTALSNRNVENTYANSLYTTYGAFANYKKTIQNHNLALLAGMTSEKDAFNDLYAKRAYMIDDKLDAINTGDATYDDNSGGANTWGLVSYIGRLNYNFKETYLLEATFRRDGSSKLAPENRWADFVGASAGVRISELKFIKDLNVFNNLKIRGSYGEMGSLSGIGNYDYLSNMSLGTTVFGTTPGQISTANISGMTSRNRTWERVASTNFGADFTVLKNRLRGSFDYFIRQNKGMLIDVTYPSVLGAGAPRSNDGNFVAKGFELSLNWKDKIGEDFKYNVGVSLADARTEVTKYPGKVSFGSGINSIIEGKPINSIYVYRTDGYLQNEAEVLDYYSKVSGSGSIIPSKGYSGATGVVDRLTPGSVKKLDLRGPKDANGNYTAADGAITTADLDYYGDANPHYNFGINLGASYKGFDFNAFFQGIGQQYIVRSDMMSAPFRWGWTNQNGIFLGNTWTAVNTNAKYPVMSRNGGRNGWNYANINDINVTNVSYMRCKSLVLGYTIPELLVSKAGIGNVRLWVSGDNLFEFDNVKDGFDPESKAATGQGNVDVYARTISFGIDLTF
ncbi:MAG TPA: SusC/RagA family TonB-linked outer membrane protein [Prolixibacteraceae bacterium]|nr:SusC/RagA family TonB-linked outer membrane protein [Prolixibacteraceae bacterium]